MSEIQFNEDLLNKFCFVFDRKKTISYYLFKNVITDKNTYEVYSPLSFKQGFFSKLYNKFLYKLGKFKIRKNNFKDKIIFFTNESIQNVPRRLLLKIKKKSKAVVLFFIDELFNNYNSIRFAKKIMGDNDKFFNLIYTFSPMDAENYLINFNDSYYSKLKITPSDNLTDLFFVGSLKDRGNILQETFNYLNQNDINCNFIISTSSKNRNNKNFNYRTIPYNECISNVMSTKCILDIVDTRQSGMTLRYYEAIVYNKKLLTNNVNIKNMPYYDERFMKIFTDVDDIKKINLEWFKDDTLIDYGYKGEFEPISFLKNILNALKVF